MTPPAGRRHASPAAAHDREYALARKAGPVSEFTVSIPLLGRLRGGAGR